MYHINISVRPQLLYSKSIAIGNKNISKLKNFFLKKSQCRENTAVLCQISYNNFHKLASFKHLNNKIIHFNCDLEANYQMPIIYGH